MGVHVLPRFSVFHKFPALAATYHTFEFLGSTAMSDSRPVVRLGPIDRNARFLNVSGVRRSAPPCPKAVAAIATTPTHVQTRLIRVLRSKVAANLAGPRLQ